MTRRVLLPHPCREESVRSVENLMSAAYTFDEPSVTKV